MDEELEQRLAAARERVRELGRGPGGETMDVWRAALDDVLAAERDLAAARGEQYAQVIDIGPGWDSSAPPPHLICSASRAFVVCRSGQPARDGRSAYTSLVSLTDVHPFTVIELRGCAEIRFGGPNEEAISGHPLHGKGLAPYRAHEVVNSRWIEEAVAVSSVHPGHSDTPFRQLRHYALLFHEQMVEALALDVRSRPARGTLREIMTSLASTLTDPPTRPEEVRRGPSQLSHGASGAIRRFAGWVARGSAGYPMLEGINYWDELKDSPSQMETCFAIFANVLELDDQGEPVNEKYAERRAASWLYRYCTGELPPGEAGLEPWEGMLY